MPSITAIGVPVPGYVYVEADFSDVAATSICVDRVSPDGSRFPLRPYVSYDADGCLSASCGLGIWWDTEAPFDTELVYCATGNDAAGNTIMTLPAALVTDTFTRVVAAGWGSTDTGQAWTSTGGAAADYSVTGTRGQHAVTSTGVPRVSSLVMTTPNADAKITMFPTALALTQNLEQYLWLRADAAGANGYRARVRYTTAGMVDLILESVTAGVATSLGTAIGVFAYGAASGVDVRFRAWGNQLTATMWDTTTPEPTAQVSVTDSTWTAPGILAVSSQRLPGNTNGTVNFQWDNLTVGDVCAVEVPLEVCSSPVTLVGDGCFRLGDPVRPCNDVTVCLTEEDECPPEGGVFFKTMHAEDYVDNSGQFLPVNAFRGVTVDRQRRDTDSQLDLVTGLFTDRDAVLALLEPGGPLRWRGPAEYGTRDRYMAVFDVTVSSALLDLTQQPRVFRLPWSARDAPVGPSLGVCGTRIMDMCDVYPTIDAMAAAGLTYADLLRGYAGTGVSVTMAVWNDVNADFVDWNDVNATESDWLDVLAGDP